MTNQIRAPPKLHLAIQAALTTTCNDSLRVVITVFHMTSPNFEEGCATASDDGAERGPPIGFAQSRLPGFTAHSVDDFVED